MTTFSSFFLVFAVVTDKFVSSDHLVALTNFGVILASLLVAAVTVHEAHKTIRKTGDDMVKVVQSDNRLLARILAGPFIRTVNGKHRKNG